MEMEKKEETPRDESEGGNMRVASLGMACHYGVEIKGIGRGTEIIRDEEESVHL